MGVINSNTNHLITFSSFWDTPISCFSNIRSIEPTAITLKQWLDACTNPIGEKANLHQKKVESVRNTGNAELKKTLPAISPGAVIKTRAKALSEAEKIKNLTGWMQFDIDLKDNPHISSAIHVRNQVKKIIYVAYCSLSVSGKGVWGIVKVKHPELYKNHFEQLKIDFASRNIKLDPSKGGNPTDLRIYSYDPDAYIADTFKIYDRIYKPPAPKRLLNTKKIAINSEKDNVEKCLNQIVNRGLDLTADYNTWLSIGFNFSSTFGKSGRDYFHIVSQFYAHYNQGETDDQFDACLNSNKSADLSTFYKACKDNNVFFMESTAAATERKTQKQAASTKPSEKEPQESYLELQTDDVLDLLCFDETKPEFNNIIIQRMQTTKGKFDILFTAEGDLFDRGNEPGIFKELSIYYNREFIPIRFNNTIAWAQEIA